MKKAHNKQSDSPVFLCSLASMVIIHACFCPLFAGNGSSSLGTIPIMEPRLTIQSTGMDEHIYCEPTPLTHTTQERSRRKSPYQSLEQGMRLLEQERAEQFFCAIAAQNAAEITSLAQSINPNVKNLAGQTPLMEAVQAGYLAGVQALLNAPSIDVNAFNGDHNTALMLAIKKGSLEMVQTLLDALDIDVNASGGGTRTALMLAAEKGDLEIVKALLSVNGIDVQKIIEGHTALSLAAQAAQKNHADVVRTLLAAIYADQRLIESLLVSLLMTNKFAITSPSTKTIRGAQAPA